MEKIESSSSSVAISMLSDFSNFTFFVQLLIHLLATRKESGIALHPFEKQLGELE